MNVDHALIAMVQQASPASRQALREVLANRRGLHFRLYRWMDERALTNADVAAMVGCCEGTVTRAKNKGYLSRQMERAFEMLVAS